MEKIKTTIILFCWDWYHFLDGAIMNIFEQTALCQIIVLTHKESPELRKITDKYNLKVFICEEKNSITRLNKAIEKVQTPYYILKGVDDFFEYTYINKAEKILNEKQEIEVVHCDIELFGLEIGRWNSEGLSELVLQHNTMFFSSVIRKSLWERIGGYDENIPYEILEDWDFWVRAYKAGARSAHIPEPLFLYRTHEKQLSRTKVPLHSGPAMEYLNNKWKTL